MKLVASRALARHPLNVVRLPGGELLVLAMNHAEALLEAYDPGLAPMWRVPCGGIELLLAPDGTPWVLQKVGASAFGDQGACLAHIEARVPDGMRVSAFARVDDDLIFAFQPPHHGPLRAPILERVGSGGDVRWSTPLPVGVVADHGVVQMSADEGWKPRPVDAWTPRTWLSTSRTLDVSGDAVLACFSDMPVSGIGFGYVLSLDDGALRFTTKQGPIHATASLGGGAFLVGYQGYGAFETLRYERDGRTRTRWATHGHYVVASNDVRVIEMENVFPSKMHLARRTLGGEVIRGAWLDGYSTSLPCVHADGTVLFFRDGALQAARDLQIDDKLELCDSRDRIPSTQIVAGDQSAYFALGSAPSSGDSARLVRVDL
jgi:hypothetical protein